MFNSSIEAADIIQGNLGNCYFLSAIAALTEFPSYLETLFVFKQCNDYGYYEVELFLDGEWQIVFVDSYFPIIKGSKTFKFSQPNGEELWLIILEKVWGKVNGSYSNTISGWPSDSFVALTGCIVEKYIVNNEEDSELWSKLTSADKKNFVMCASTGAKPSQLKGTNIDSSVDTKPLPSNEERGLISNHAYSLTDAVELLSESLYDKVSNKDEKQNEETFHKEPNKENIVRLLKIRNPWGETEWNGDWADSSESWSTAMIEQVHMKKKNDGCFFIELSDFRRYFQVLHICSFNPNNRKLNFKVETIEDWSHPQFYIIDIQKQGTLGVSCYFPHWRFNRGIDKEKLNNPTTVMLSKIEEVHGSSNEEKEKEKSSNSTSNLMSDNIESMTSYNYEFLKAKFGASDYIGFVSDVSPGKYLISLISPISHFSEGVNSEGAALKIPIKSSIRLSIEFNTKFIVRHITLPPPEPLPNKIPKAYSQYFTLLEEVITQAAIKVNQSKLGPSTGKPISTLIENQFLSTGLGFRLVMNNTKDRIVLWQNDSKELLNMIMIEPYEQGLFNNNDTGDNSHVKVSSNINQLSSSDEKASIFPGLSKIFMGMKLTDYGKFWFNLKSNYKEFQLKGSSDLKRKQKQTDISQYVNYNRNTDESLFFFRYFSYSPFMFSSLNLKRVFQKVGYEKIVSSIKIIIDSLNSNNMSKDDIEKKEDKGTGEDDEKCAVVGNSQMRFLIALPKYFYKNKHYEESKSSEEESEVMEASELTDLKLVESKNSLDEFYIKSYSGGVYIGELNKEKERHGRGVYLFLTKHGSSSEGGNVRDKDIVSIDNLNNSILDKIEYLYFGYFESSHYTKGCLYHKGKLTKYTGI
eukprot:CAMPEP_0170530350 /NCGR_PEP_ID=MMETSP0209-20121228/45630_1 /TAXON_ID=665100 ORGANISM="Litonotus pictus, Strain P1" /NCGR_SAMPLE_ID=MMETSP0209 /ASSEMBLY_ACC=CAM_ASM_000301 /LENGTH=860 /DNA_ID=CAMNT_0010823355 /DNA_START=195 /DNA_END=2777 /DNA_ORIENTATION=+